MDQNVSIELLNKPFSLPEEVSAFVTALNDCAIDDFDTLEVQDAKHQFTDQITKRFSSRLAHHSQRVDEVCAEIRRQNDRGQDGCISEAIIDCCIQHDVFDYEYEVLGHRTNTLRVNNQVTSIQNRTVLQPTVSNALATQANPNSSALAVTTPLNVVSKDIVKDLGSSKLSTYIFANSRVGKTTFVRAVMYEKFCYRRDTEFIIIDLQGSPWFGFELSEDIVTLSQVDHDPNSKHEKMLLITEAIKKVNTIFKKRTSLKQKAIRNNCLAPDFHPVCLVFNEWNWYYGWAKEYLKSGEGKASIIKEYKKVASDKNIENPLLPMQAASIVSNMFTSGADCMISVAATGQDFQKEETGFSPNTLANVNLVALGRIDKDGDGGYGSTEKVLSSSRIESGEIKALLKEQHDKYKSSRIPVVLSTQGSGSIGVLNDYSDYETTTLVHAYKYPVVRNT